ncbi:hypothetical protein HNQ38_001819 [Desulfovibrio intestinalis]|uniref:Uncharacterized protein n=1 Tax=Desulfovibrio intestinalis TaxID=58621 RepID=A0A7W8FEF2_9BACT|nr:hypothetical protein [Desulfovibrio intestinalis]
MPVGSYILLGYQQRGVRRRLQLMIVEMARAGLQRPKSSGTIMMPTLSAERPEADQTLLVLGRSDR